MPFSKQPYSSTLVFHKLHWAWKQSRILLTSSRFFLVPTKFVLAYV